MRFFCLESWCHVHRHRMTTPELLSPDLLELPGRIINRTRAVLPFDCGGIALGAAAEVPLMLHLAYPAPATYPVQAGLLCRATAQRQPILVLDIQPNSPDWVFRPALRAVLAIPLALERSALGALLFGSDTPGACDADNLADRAALALDTARRVTSPPGIAAEGVTLIETHNAIKFTHYGGSTIRAGVEEGAAPTGVWCSVTDTGIGIAPENQMIFFDEFRQVDGTSTRQYEGTGLGLAITRRLLSLMNGHIAVKSSLGQGSTFTFWLPVARLVAV